MYIEIRKLTPDLLEDYVHFFDSTQHADGKSEHSCYCVWWCNANTKLDSLKCYGRRRFLGSVSTQESTPEITLKSIFCFTISPKMQRRGLPYGSWNVFFGKI